MAEIIKSFIPVPTASQQSNKKLYEKPKLEIIGDVRSLTLGPSFGTLESGSPSTKLRHPHSAPRDSLN
jgi:hypothetical protein